MKKAIFITLIIVVILELTWFNRQFYGQFFQGESGTDYKVLSPLTSKIQINRTALGFEDPDRDVISVRIKLKPEYKEANFKIIYSDEEKIRKETSVFKVVQSVPVTHYKEITPYGKVGWLIIESYDSEMRADEVEVNAKIPIFFCIPRVLIISGMILIIYLIYRTKNGEIEFNPKSKKQTIVSAGVLTGLLIIGYIMTASSGYGEAGSPYKEMTEAILTGKLYLDVEIPEALTNMTNPYDAAARSEINLYSVHWDSSYYKGKIYMYHGILPVLILYLPYYLVTGNHLTNFVACYLCSAGSCVGAWLLWREIVKRFLSKMTAALYLASTTAIIGSSLLMTNFSYPLKYAISSAAGMMLVLPGIWLIIRSTDGEKPKNQMIRTVTGSLLMALTVGCRPTILLFSILIPILKWQQIKDGNKREKLLIISSILTPFVIVGIAAAWYNHARFDSILEFGIKYQLTGWDVSKYRLANPLGKINLLAKGIKDTLFNVPRFSTTFPYFLTTGSETTETWFPTRYYLGRIGLIFFPIMWWLMALPHICKETWKENKEWWRILLMMIAVGSGIALFQIMKVGTEIRYQIDYMILLAIPAGSVMYYAWKLTGFKKIYAKHLSLLSIATYILSIPIPNDGSMWPVTAEIYAKLQWFFAPF